MLIVEGFKKVGKDYFINNKLKKLGYHAMHYDDFGFKTGDYGLHLPNSFIVGAVLAKLPKEISEKIALNRGILSTWLYSIQDNMGVEKYVERHYLDDLVKNKARVIFITHHSKETAREMFRMRERRENDEHDNFINFEDYWRQYLDYSERAIDVMKLLTKYGIRCGVYSNKELERDDCLFFMGESHEER